MLSFKPTFSLSSFTFIKRLFSSSLSAIRVVSSAYLRLLIRLPANLIPICASSSPAFGKPLQYSYLENPMNSMKRQKDRTLKNELPRSVGAQYATGEQCRNNSRKNEETEPKQKRYPVVDVNGDGSKVPCCKDQYDIGTWNVRPMNQGKLEVVKQEMARVNVDILGISKLRWTGMEEFKSDDPHIYYCGQESLRRNGVPIIVNKRIQNAVLGCNLKTDRMISFHFQGKQFSIKVF